MKHVHMFQQNFSSGIQKNERMTYLITDVHYLLISPVYLCSEIRPEEENREERK